MDKFQSRTVSIRSQPSRSSALQKKTEDETRETLSGRTAMRKSISAADGCAEHQSNRRWRKATHPEARIEAALRRQLALKQFYRQVVSLVKPCLDELAQITLEELENDGQHHAQGYEYDAVIANLKSRLDRRKRQLLQTQRLNHEQLLLRYNAEKHARRNQCHNLLEDIRIRHLVN